MQVQRNYMVLFTLCGCGGMMKYWNIELDILHGQQAFISAKSAPRNEASIGPPVVQKRQEEENVTSTWWSLFMASSEQICGLWRSSCSRHRPQIFNLAFFFFSKFSFNSKAATLLAMFHSAFTIQPTQCHSYLTWHFPFNVPKQPPGGRRTTLLCVFECAARHLSTLCSHLVPLGPNMIMVVVNLFAEEAFAAKGA